MPYLETDYFSINYPEYFNIAKQEKAALTLNSNKADSEDNNTQIQINLYKITELDASYISGNTIKEKFIDERLQSFYEAKALESIEQKHQGLTTYVLTALTDTEFQNQALKVSYFFACIRLNDDYYIEFTVWHSFKEEGGLEPWVLACFESLTITELDKKKLQELNAQHLSDLEITYEEYIADFDDSDPIPEIQAFTIPSNEQNSFKIDGEAFEFDTENCQLSIPEFSKELVLTLRVKTDNVLKWQEKKLLDDYRIDKISLQFSARGIHQSAIPTGQFKIQEDKTNAPYFLHLRKEGFEYSLDFFGTITFKEGWVGFNGYLKPPYSAEPIFGIEVYYKFDVSTLDWSNYQYQSLEETQSAKPQEVRFLTITNPSFSTLPPEVLTFTNLEHLTIRHHSNQWEKERVPFKNLPDNIDNLQKLTGLYINGTELESLPESLGQLKSLEHLSINRSQLKTTPNSLWQLPNLHYLFLSDNQLTHVPSYINLPSLQNIDLSKNALKTLDKALAQQPKLKSLKLKHNPWQSLAPEFNQIKDIDLSIDDKLRLLDFTYLGADGKGLATWDDATYCAQSDSTLVTQINEVIAENNLNDHAQALRSMVKKAIGFTHTIDEDYAKIGNHRFGGMPDLPNSIAYPTFTGWHHEGDKEFIYEFIAQINCEEIAHLQDYLPRTGILFFFLQTVHNIYDSSDQEHVAKVIYHPTITDLKAGNRFDFDEKDYYEMFDKGYRSFKAKADKQNSSPSFYASNINTYYFVGDAVVIKGKGRQFLKDLYDSFEEPIIQKNPFDHAINAYGFTQNEAPELQAALAYKGNPEDWLNLLVVKSVGDFQWGDAGDLFFVIHKSDLAKQDFSNIFVTLESS